MEDLTLCVQAAPGGWRIACPVGGLSLMFLSGAEAEAKAHAFAERLSASGRDVRVVIEDRHGRVAGATRYFSADELALI